MVVPFGFSIGDFITGVGAFKTVCVALKEHGGAATEFQEVSKELDGIQKIIGNVKNIPGNASTNSHEVTQVSKTLAAQADVCFMLVKRFTERLSRYDPTLGAKAPQRYTRGTWSKTAWALFFSPELRKFRLVIGTSASSITLSFCHLLYLHSLASEGSLIEQHKQQEQSISSKFTAVSNQLDSNHAALNSQNEVVLQALNNLTAKMVVLENQQLDNHEKLKQAMMPVESDILKHLSELSSKLDELLGERQATNTRFSNTEIGLAMRTREQQSILAMSDGQNVRQLTDAELHAVLRARARKSLLKLHWDSSIVDLMKLLDLESGLFVRDLLAQELDVNAGPLGSSDQNIALHKALMRRLAQNGGMVPENIYDLIHL